ncbi:MAG TPA: PSD1 and planctomycete cytochrome C domain-containing protein [Pirellulales bacterium]|jgi:hypothetical protein|nr:PSD1 and planctomycete cytochrome C domain-containing protein [Pirellulales bacterium]
MRIFPSRSLFVWLVIGGALGLGASRRSREACAADPAAASAKPDTAQPAAAADKPATELKPVAVSPETAEFFEKHVRPVLVEHCFECHSAKKQEGELRLDSIQAVLKGTDEGPVVAPGKPEQSKLIRAVRQTGDLKMPPKEKLSDEQIAALTKWIELGLPWPEDPHGKDLAAAETAAQKHWAFQPLTHPEPPAVKNAAWCLTGADHFILARLEADGLTPAPAAARATWLRRVTFDLIGLPPTPAETEAFVRDDAPEASAKVVDRLLASPHFGERWGRYWLDVARYADTKGYVFTEDRNYPFAYVYRDWVVASLNQDLPYDQFILKQVAADQLEPQGDKHDWAALGYLTLGRRFLNNKPDIIDDRIDVICRGLMGLTVGCARCHDHKFDPIPSKDYYSLYGVLSPAQEKQIPIMPPSAAYEKELKVREGAVAALVRKKVAALTDHLRAEVAQYMLAATKAKDAKTDDFSQVQNEKDLRPSVVAHWRNYLEHARQARAKLFAPWTAFAALKPEEYAARGAELALEFADQTDPAQLNPHVAAAFAGDPPQNLKEVAERYAALFAAADQEHQTAEKLAKDQHQPLPATEADPAWQDLYNVLHADDTPARVADKDAEKLLDKPAKDEIRRYRQRVTEWQSSPAAPLQALVLEDGPVGGNPHVFLRGNANTPGPEVPRQFPAVAAGKDRHPFQKGSGRLELAQAIANKNNPFTARVWANRVWLHLFGSGLVRTPSDFGMRTDAPSHPELLDYLANQLIEQGWSTKHLIREIVLSQTYHEAAVRPADDPQAVAAAKVDPENRLLWRMNRRRLDLEGMRDSLLDVAGQLDPAVGGPSVEIATAQYSKRRTIYGHIDRQNLPSLFRTFDFAGPDTHSPQRFVTTIPQQALFFMNSPFVIDQAKAICNRAEIKDVTDPAERIQRLYALCFGRSASDDELRLARQFVDSAATNPGDKLSPWERLAQALFMTNEFVFLD